ncbi:MAG: hypothetical protein OSA92_15195 [Pirellulaceae bacterium]|nr:hypothetical protein [Pirellulaceae bacterium]
MAYNKIRLNVYTMMLVLSFMAVTASTVLLWLEWEKWQLQG